VRRLKRHYPDAACSLDFRTPLDLLVATILSAQCTDERVNRVTKSLFRKYPTAAAYAEAPLSDLKGEIQSTGFFNNKAKSIERAARRWFSDTQARSPRTSTSWSSCPAWAARRPTSCWGPPTESPPAWSSTRTWRASPGAWD